MHKGIDLVTWVRKMKEESKIPLKCDTCGYKWGYGGEKRNNERATCPSCSGKVKIQKNRID